MGMCLPCLGCCSEDYDQPDQETRRRQQAEAADRRKSENERKGIKDPEALKRKQKKQEEMRKMSGIQGGGECNLKWQLG